MVSPGGAADDWMYLFIGTRLASHGFVVAIADHYNDPVYPWSAPTDEGAVTLFKRTRDMSFAITELLLKNGTIGEALQGVIDPSRIAMSGHSLGGYAAYALAGGDDEVCDASYSFSPQSTCVPSSPDPRIQAIVSLDGSSQFMRYHELARISVPSLILGETFDYILFQTGADPSLCAFNARPHAAINRSDSYRVDITGANHGSFSNYCDVFRVMSSLGVSVSGTGMNPNAWPCAASYHFDPANNPTTNQIVTTYMLAFLNTYFGREDDSWMLTSSYAKQYQPQVEFFDSEACSQCQPGQGEYAYRPNPCQCSVSPIDPADYFP
jgi:predicted dienelactone hydrolase